MKLLLSLLVSLSFALASDITWFDHIEEAKTLAEKEHKPLILMLSSPSCGICNMMKEKVFTDKDIIKRQSRDFISVRLEVDFDDIPAEFEVLGTPTFYTFNAKGKFLLRKIGGSTVMGWNKFLDSLDKLK
jgi:thioredoxin-related protein